MATSVGFQLGLLPERKLNKRALAASYGFLIFLLILMVNIGWIWPDSLDIRRQYHVTELIPMPSLQPEPLKAKPPAHILKAKLLPKAPVFDAPKLTGTAGGSCPAAAATGGGGAQDRGQPFRACSGQAGYGRSPADVDRAYRRVRQFGDSDGQCSDPEGSDRRFRRPQRCSGTGQAQCAPGGGQHGLVRSATRRGKRQRSGRDQRYQGHDCQRRFRQRDCTSRTG